jgi:hypothetical protein
MSGHEQIVNSAEHLGACIDVNQGVVRGSIPLDEVWFADPYESGGNATVLFYRGLLPDDRGGIYCSTIPGEDPSISHARVPAAAESFALGTVKVFDRKSTILGRISLAVRTRKG